MIPKRFHFVFGLARQTEPFHLVHYLCLASCLATQKPDAIYFYYHYEPYGAYWERIREQLVCVKIPRVEFVAQYRYPDRRVARYKYAHASDFVRLEKLLAHGGVYADLDTLFVNPLPRALYEQSFVLGRENEIFDPRTRTPRPSLCNAFIMAERDAPFGRLWLEQMPAAFDGTWSKHSTLLPNELAQQHPDLIHIEPARTFYKHMWTREGIHTLLEGLDTDNADVVSFHLWAHLWWSRWRRDFSAFHGGKLTYDYVQNVDTTYDVVARKYLPPRPARSFWIAPASNATYKASRAIQPLRAAAREAGMKIYILTKLAAFSLVKEDRFPRATEHLDYARRQWKHPEVRTRFHARNRFEQHVILEDVAMWDAYGIAPLTFAPEDVILDIGAHVGIFSYLCYQRGARNIHAYEAEVKNFERLAQSVGDLAGIYPHHLAVFRSDLTGVNTLRHPGYCGANTGGGTVLFCGQSADLKTQTITVEQPTIQRTDVIALDEILRKFARVRLMKLDCEGSEFPILLTSRLLERVEQIVGEYHEMEPALYARLDPAAQLPNFSVYRVEHLVAHLEQCGFQVRVRAASSHLGSLRATRRTSAP
jgi:FkbM family methyltransferase